MIPEEVCHFTKAETAIDKILLENKLKIGQLRYTNDPRESRTKEPLLFHRSDLPINTDPKGIELKSKISAESQRIQLDEWKVLCVSLHRARIKSKDPNYAVYNLHVRNGYSNPAMWAHYTENHKGVCLIFSGKALHQNIQNELGDKCKIFNGKVKYSINHKLTSTPAIAIKSLDMNIEDAVRKHFFTYCQELFFHKHPSWEYEKEYRWLLHSKEESNQFVSIQNAIKAVIVGSDFPKEMEPPLREICKELGIPAGKMDWFNGIAYPKFDSIYKL